MQKVWKKSRKPFKSGKKVNTVKEVTTNPNTGMPAYTFLEDDSVVDIRTCEDVPQGYIDLAKKLDSKRKNMKKLEDMFCPGNDVVFGIGDVIRKTEWDNPTQWFKIVETHDPEYVVGWFYFDDKRDGPPRGLVKNLTGTWVKK